MIKFEKVSLKEFSSAVKNLIPISDDEVKRIWDNLKLPERSTTGSAGYDFFAPFAFHLSGEQIIMRAYSIISPTGEPKIDVRLDHGVIKIPTGIRFVTDRNDVVLLCAPRSGLGVKTGLAIRNTLGVIDSDYWESDNEGHIWVCLEAEDAVDIEMGKAFMQSIIVPFLTIDNEDTDNLEVRNGGFGSTNK